MSSEHPDNPPPYSDTIGVADNPSSPEAKKSPQPNSTPFQWTLQDEVAASRSERVTAAAGKIQSVLDTRARAGLSSTTIVLLPSEQRFSEGQLNDQPEVVGFSGDEKPLLILLAGNGGNIEFWSQAQAIERLEHMLCTNMGVAGSNNSTGKRAEWDVNAPQQWYKRRYGEHNARGIGVEEPARVKKYIDVELEEVYVRTTTDFGLFETITLQAVTIRVDL